MVVERVEEAMVAGDWAGEKAETVVEKAAAETVAELVAERAADTELVAMAVDCTGEVAVPLEHQ